MTHAHVVAGVTVLIDEPADSAPQDTLVFLHGWPDSAALWDETVGALRGRWRCVRFSWPGFGADDPPGLRTLDDLMRVLHEVINTCCRGWPVTLVLHDWGCIFGYHYARKHPQMVQRVVGIDIGDAGSRSHRNDLSLGAKLGIVSYQLWLALAWRIGGGLGDRMARGMAARMRVPLPPERIHARMGYPYWLAWTGGLAATKPFQPTVPMLYVYGRRKPFQFQSRGWCKAVASQPGSAVHKLDAGHWVMRDAKADWQRILSEWLA